MNSKLLMALALLLLGTLSHAAERAVMGTVKSVSETAITIETMGTVRESITIRVLPTTIFIKDGGSASLKELKVGEHVVASVNPNGRATKIVFGRMFDHMDMHH